jgi:hypothetical protein
VSKRKERPLSELVLDDFLQEIDRTRSGFHLRDATFGLKEIEGQGGAEQALEEIILKVIKRNGQKICSRRRPLFSGVTPKVYGVKVGSSRFPRWRIRPKYLRPVLRTLLARALQTLVCLPAKDNKPTNTTHQLRALARHLLKASQEARSTFGCNETNSRIATYFRGSRDPGKERLYQIPGEMEWAGETLSTICAHTRLFGSKMDSPNPQVRFGLFVLGWIGQAAGQPRYELSRTLMSAAFAASNLEPPKWIDRLAIEMSSKRERRKSWVREIRRLFAEEATSGAT